MSLQMQTLSMFPAGLLRLQADQSSFWCWASTLTDASLLQGVHDKMAQQGSPAAATLAVKTLLQMCEVSCSSTVAVQSLLLCCAAPKRCEGTTSGHVLHHACLHHARASCTNQSAPSNQ